MTAYAEGRIDWAWIWRDNRADLGAIAFVAAFITAFVLGFGVTPFYYYDMLVMSAVATGPALLVLAIFSGLGDRLANGLGNANAMGVINAAAGIFLVAIASPGNVLLWANERFDTSPAKIEVVPVLEKWTRTGRRTTTYLASVTTSIPSPLGKHSFYDAQPVAMRKAQWDSLVPGNSRLALREHHGAFHASWFEPDVEVLK